MSLINKTIVIAALARNCEKYLADNLTRIEELRECFTHSYVVILENDSKDATKQILSFYKNKTSEVKLISKDYHGEYPIKKYPKSNYQEKSCNRIARMAFLRNQILSCVKTIAFDYLITIDIDIYSFSVKGVCDAIANAPSNWGGLFANGRIFFKSGHSTIHPLPIVYDIYACFVNTLDFNKLSRLYLNDTYLLIRQYLIGQLSDKHDYLPVVSAYGGLGIYKKECLTNEYQVKTPLTWKNSNASLCEHVLFNKNICDNGYQCYLVKNLEVCYSIIDKGGFKGFLVKNYPLLYAIASHCAKILKRIQSKF